MQKLCALLLLLAACGGETTPPPSKGPCDEVTGVDSYVQNLEKTGTTGLVFRLTDALPAPPNRGENRWTLELLDGASPVEDAEISMKPWMPEHGHGTQPPRFTGAAKGTTYEFGPFDLIMSGKWEMTLSAKRASGATDEVKFAFCVEG